MVAHAQPLLFGICKSMYTGRYVDGTGKKIWPTLSLNDLKTMPVQNGHSLWQHFLGKRAAVVVAGILTVVIIFFSREVPGLCQDMRIVFLIEHLTHLMALSP